MPHQSSPRTRYRRPGRSAAVTFFHFGGAFEKGATLAEIAKATKRQNHSIRGFISGTITKKMGLAVESSKNESGERTYRIGE